MARNARYARRKRHGPIVAPAHQPPYPAAVDVRQRNTSHKEKPPAAGAAMLTTRLDARTQDPSPTCRGLTSRSLSGEDGASSFGRCGMRGIARVAGILVVPLAMLAG